MNRRSILKFIGVIPAMSTSIAAKAAAGLNVSDLGYSVPGVPGTPPQSGTLCESDEEKLAYLSTRGLPDYIRQKQRRYIKGNIFKLDPDLADNKSFSLSTKMRIQCDRLLERAEQDSVESVKQDIAQKLFYKLHGFTFW